MAEPPQILRPARPPVSEGTLRLRPRYCECDPMGVAHHAAYIPWLEMGRTELLRSSGMSYADLERAGVLLVVVRINVRYRRPARYDDLVELRTRVSGGSRVKIEHEYELVLVESADKAPVDADSPPVLMTAETTLGCVGRDGRPMALPDWLSGGGGGG